MKRIYLDHASITPVDSRVLRAMKPYCQTDFANPASLYLEGVKNKKIIDDCRAKIAQILGVHADEIIFTSGGTEANNLALLGVFEATKSKIKTPHVITTAIEHPSIMEVCREIEKRGGKVTYVGVGENGLVDPKEIKKALRPETVLVSVMYANNEIGTIQPIQEIAKVIREFKKTEKRNQQLPDRPRLGQAPRSGLSGSSLVSDVGFPYFHSDASQAAEYLDLNVERLGVDFMTIDGTKIYGPRGAGLLFGRRRRNFLPILFGGGQQTGRRAGTENVPAAVGLATALDLSEKRKKKNESNRLIKLRDYFIDQVLKNVPKAILNGTQTERLPNNINFCFPHLDAEFAVLQLDAKGIAISSVTSCLNQSEDSSSYVIEALDLKRKKKCSKSSLRISLGRKTSKKELDFCLKILYNVINGRAH